MYIQAIAVAKFKRKEKLYMQMISVSSSNLSAVGYEHQTLYVRFHSGATYAYSGVPESVYRALMSAGSKGRYFETHVKPVYPYRRVG